MKKLWKKVVAVVCAFSMMIAGIGVIPEVQAEDVPTGLTDVRWSDVGITEDTTIVGGCNDANNWGVNEKSVTSGKSLVNSSFRGTLKFRETTSENMYFQYGAGSLSTQGSKGIRFTLQNDGTLRVYNMANDSETVEILDATAAGLASGTFSNTAFELGIDVWQPADSADLKMIVYIDQQQYGSEPYVITNGAANMDNAMILTTQTEGNYIDITVEREKSPDSLIKVGWKDFGIVGEKVCNASGDAASIHTTEVVQTGISFRGKVKYNRADSADALMLAFGSTGWDGLRVTQTSDDKLVIQGVGGSNPVLAEITTTQAGVTSFANQEFELGLDIWSVNDTDLKVNVFVNGAQMTKTAGVWEGAVTSGYMKKGLCYYITGSSSIVLIPEIELSPEDLTKIEWRDFGIAEEKTCKASGDAASIHVAEVVQTGISFRGKVKYNRADSADALMLAFGSTGWDGLRVTQTSDDKLVIQGVGGSSPVLAEITTTQAGVASFANQEFELGLDIWSVNDTDLKVNVFVNGVQMTKTAGVWEGAVTNGYMKKGLCYYITGSSSIVLTPEFEPSTEDLTKIGWKDFGIAGEKVCEVSGDAASIHATEVVQTGIAFRGQVKYNRVDSADDLMLAFGSTGWDGLRVTQTSDDKLVIQGIGGSSPVLAEITTEQAGVTSFANQEFELGLNIWSVNDTDLKVNVFVNGVQITKKAGVWEGAVTSGYMKKGLCYYVTGSSSIVLIPEFEPSPEGLTKIGWKDFGIDENRTCIASGDAASIHATEVVQTGISFRGKVKYNRANSADDLMLAFGSTGWDGLRVTQTNADKLVIQGIGGSSPVLAELTTTQAGVTSFANQEFELGLDIWSVNDTDLKVNVFVNGVQVTKKAGVWKGAATNGYMKKGLCYYITGSSSIVLIPEFEPSPEGLTKIGWKDFGFSGQDYAYTTGGFSAVEHCSTVTLKKASFRGVLQFKGAGTRLTYGDNWDGWEHGLNFAPTEEGKLKVWNALDRTNLDVTLEPSKVGITSFLNQEFELGIDSWEDGNDIKFNIFVNGQQYNQSAYIWKDGVKNEYLYPYMTAGLLISGASDSITVELPVEEACNLDTTPSGYLLNGSTIRVNDNVAATGDTLTAIGDYRVLYIDETGVTAKNVGCYKTGDAHVDGVIDARDLVAVKKEIKKVSEGQASSSVARHYAADVNGDKAYDDTDMQWIRNNILGVANVTPKLVASYSLTEDALEMPIGGFNGPYRVSDRDLITDDIYKKIADCGINFISFTNHFYPTNGNDTKAMETIQKQLLLAEKYNVGLFIQDEHIQQSSETWTKEALANRIKEYSNYKSFLGLAIFDEPTLTGVYGSTDDGAGDAFNIRKSVSKLTNSFSNIAAYANMLPLNTNMKLDISVTDEDAYRTYLTTYCEEYNPKFLSYDNYPFEWKQNAITGTSVKADYYYFKNLAIVREIASQYQIPFWTHVQSGDSFDQGAGGTNAHNPSEGKFKWQINVELAFGAKGIQYFPLVQPDGYELTANGESDYTRNGLIGKDGNTTEWYTYAQEMNQQIRNMDHVLMNSVNKGIMVTGGYATTNMNEANESSNILLPSFALSEENPTITGLTTDETNHTYGAIAGCFDYQGKAAVYVVNYNVTASQNITLTWDKSCSYKVLDGNGETAREPATACTLALGAGEAALLVFE